VMVVDVLGAVVAIDVPTELTAPVAAALADTRSDARHDRVLRLEPQGDGRLRLLDDGEPVLIEVEERHAVGTLVWWLNRLVAASSSHLVLHAGCVAGRTGGVLLPGGSGAGKSWLTGACVDDGLAYLSDEHAVVDLDTGLLLPFPKPLDLGDDGLVAATALRCDALSPPIHVGAVVFPRYVAGAELEVAELDSKATLLSLASHATNLGALGEPAFRWLVAFASRPAWQVIYGSGRDAVELVRLAAQGDGDRAMPPMPVDPQSPVTSFTTTVRFGAGLAVLDHTTGSVHVLNEASALVWSCVAGATSLREIAVRAAASAPAGGFASGDIDATIAHLAHCGLLPFDHVAKLRL
jgi:hypothetical protein